MTSTHLLRSAVVACAISGAAVTAVAQQPAIRIRPAGQQQGINPESMYGKESAQGVYVRDSAVALEKFAQAQRMERLKEWSKAADLYQEVLEKFADRVVPSQVDKDNNIYQYTSVIAAVQQKMSKWPAEGLEVYRSRYEPSAQAMLEAARPDDRAALQAILSKYFATETAKLAGRRLMDLYFEAGEFSASAWLADLLLTQHPNLIVERPRVMYRQALALHMAGDEEKSKSLLAELQSKYANDTATIRGVDQKLVDSLASELGQPAPHATAVADSAWPMFGGSPSHARLSTAAGRPGAKLYSIDLAKPNYKGMQGEQASQLKQRDEMDKNSGGTLTVMPSIDHGEMFFQDGQRLYAVSIESGQPLPGWMSTYPGDRRGQYAVGKSRTLPRGQLQTVTLTDNKVLAVMGQGDRFAQMYGTEGAAGEVKLVCLDRATGAEKWVAQPRNLPEEAQILRTSEFGSSPLVVDSNVYVVARGSKGQQFEDCSVICYDLDTGKYKWHCYVASANSVANAMMMDSDGSTAPSDAIPQLAYSAGRLYVLTNLGALASIDAYGGRIVWLSIYQRDDSVSRAAVNPFLARMNNLNNGSTGSKPWMSNPVFVDGGKVFVLPSDGKYLQIYDAGTGVEVKRMDPAHLTPVPVKGEQATEADSLIAVNGSKLLVTGPTSAMYVNWEKYNLEGFDRRRNPAIEWPKDFAIRIRGRAFVANGRVLVPTEKRMFVTSIKGGRVLEEYPDYKKSAEGWRPDDAEGPGNIIVSDEHVIIAAHRRIDVYTNMDAARQKLDAELAQNPTSPEPRIRYAEVMFVSGDNETAMGKLDEAIGLLGGREKMAAGAARDRVYNTAINVAQKITRDVKDATSENLPIVQQLYDRAGAAAQSPVQQVNYRVLRSKLATTIKDYPTAVKLCQEIIAEDDWRKVPVADETTGAQGPAGNFAKRAIDQLIRTAGPNCYKSFEQDANQQFESAKNGKQADALVRVATIYPNAKVAPQALLAAADLKDAGADHRSAVQLLRQLYLTYPGGPDKRRVLESLARNYMGIPNRTSVAIARLNEAVQMGDAPLSQPMPLPGGKVLESGSIAQALNELKKARGQEISKSLPDFKLPVPHFTMVDGKRKLRPPFVSEPVESVIAGVQSLLVPPRDYQRFDRIATFSSDKGVSIYAAGSTQPLATLPAGDSPNLLWSSSGPVLWSGGTLTQFAGDSSKPAWALDLKSAPGIDAVAAVGSDEANTGIKSGDDNADGVDGAIVQGNMPVRIIRQGNRRQIFQSGMVREIAGPRPGKAIINPGGGEGIVDVKLAGDAVLVTTTAGRLLTLDGNDGRIRWQARPSERPPERLVVNEDFTALLIRGDNLATLIVIDTFTGQTVGRRTFEDGSRVPTNLALSLDGTLVYLLPDRVVLKNLYQPWGNAEKEIVDTKAAQTGQFPYVMSQQPDHLQIVDGKVLVMADQNVSLRVFSLETAKPLRYTPVDSKKEIDLTLQTGNRQPNVPVTVRVVGTQVYLIGQQSLIAYNLDHPEQSWRIPPLMQKPQTGTRDEMADVFIGRNHLVLLADTKTKVNAGKTAAYRLYTYARYGENENDSAESGVMTFFPYLQGDPSGITAWQAVNGGFYYLAADRKLHFLKGAGN